MLHFFAIYSPVSAIYSPVSAIYSLISASCSERIEFAGKELLKLGVEITEDTDLILTEEYYQRGELLCRDGDDTVVVPFQEIFVH